MMPQSLETITTQAATRHLNFAAALERWADLELEARHRAPLQALSSPGSTHP
jgi:hypothetical protein